MKKYLMAIALGAVVISAVLSTEMSWSQSLPSNDLEPRGQGQQRPSGLPGVIPELPGSSGSSASSAIQSLVAQLRDADDELKKTELTKQLEAAINKNFDHDMEGREKELTQLEERLKKLRTQLERRRKAKSEIVELQIKVLVNEAEGLGFSGQSLLEPEVHFGDFAPYPKARSGRQLGR
jgi:hypothetical protein